MKIKKQKTQKVCCKNKTEDYKHCLEAPQLDDKITHLE